MGIVLRTAFDVAGALRPKKTVLCVPRRSWFRDRSWQGGVVLPGNEVTTVVHAGVVDCPVGPSSLPFLAR
jgi:hypothetical protein